MKTKVSIFLLSLLLIGQVYLYASRVKEQTKAVKTPDYIPVETVKNDYSLEQTVTEAISFEKNPTEEYYQLNPDYVGWLAINETAVDYPVVRGTDNDFYLNHNFYKEDDLLGAIFMDYRNAGMGLDKHTVIYGHYAKHGQMFKDLDRYLSESFLDEHSEFIFSDAFSERQYEIFSVHYSYADPGLIDVKFEADEFESFTQSLTEQSLFQTETTVASDDRILTLVTCNYQVENGRLFIHAVEITD